MNYIDKEKSIKTDIAGIENRVRHAFNQGYDFGFKDGKERFKSLNQEPILDKIIDAINFAIKATDSQDDYSMGMRNGMRYVKSLIDGKEPQYESKQTDEEINLGDEVVGDYGAKGVVVGIDTYKGEVMLSLLMRNHKVPQLVKVSRYKTKTGRHFPQIVELLKQIEEYNNEKM